jgi:hypothetical protein
MNATGKCSHAVLLLAIFAAFVVNAEGEGECSVFVRSKENILWRTAAGNTVDVQVVLPPSASSATLTVSAKGYSRVYPGLASGVQPVELPEATSDETENVYDFSIAYDDPAGTVQSVKIGLLASAAADGSVEADVRTDGASKWSKTSSPVVVRIPGGGFTVDGESVDTGLDGMPGWYRFAPTGRGRRFTFAVGGELAYVDYRTAGGFSIIFR